jgi:hypothetical protein
MACTTQIQPRTHMPAAMTDCHTGGWVRGVTSHFPLHLPSHGPSELGLMQHVTGMLGMCAFHCAYKGHVPHAQQGNTDRLGLHCS